MNIDGVNFWGSNRHILHMWDKEDRAGPFIIMIDEKIRVGHPFTVYMQCDQGQSLYRLLQKQCDMKHECTMSIIVEEPKTHQSMYDILFWVVLANIKFGEVDYSMVSPIELYLTYFCRQIEDRTIYDKTIRAISGKSMHHPNGSSQLSVQ